MKTTRKRSPHGLVIAETCGQIHIRTATVRFPAFGRVLTDEGLRWAPDLGEGDGELVAVGDPSVRDLRVWVGDEFTQGDAGRVVRALQRHGIEAYGYEPQYRRDGEGPFVQYRRSGPMPMTRAGVVFNIDFGFEDGSWYFGSPWSSAASGPSCSSIAANSGPGGCARVRGARGARKRPGLAAGQPGYRSVRNRRLRRRVPPGRGRLKRCATRTTSRPAIGLLSSARWRRRPGHSAPEAGHRVREAALRAAPGGPRRAERR